MKEQSKIEKAIIDYINKSEKDEVPISSFLKTFIPDGENGKFYQKPEYSKFIRNILFSMTSQKSIELTTNSFQSLGKSHHDSADQKQKHWNLDNVEIFAVK